MNTDNTQGGAEPSLASAGSHGVDITTRLRRWTHSVAAVAASDIMDEAADEIERLRGYRDMAEADRVVAVLAAERLRITPKERDAIQTAMNAYGENNDNPECAEIESVLWGLLERTK